MDVILRHSAVGAPSVRRIPLRHRIDPALPPRIRIGHRGWHPDAAALDERLIQTAARGWRQMRMTSAAILGRWPTRAMIFPCWS
jgi:hypothetical protein